MGPADVEGHQRLAGEIRRRRRALGLSMNLAAKLAGVHRLTWRAWEQGLARPEDYNYTRIENALGWEAGSVEVVLAGGQPTVPQVIREDGPTPSGSESAELVRIAVNILADLEIQGATIRTYNRALNRLKGILDDAADITAVREEAHRIAVERLKDPPGDSTTEAN